MCDDEMPSATRDVIDESDAQLTSRIGGLTNVHVIDQRSVLTPSLPQSTGASNDWLDESHRTEAGFKTLTQHRWDVPLSMAPGWAPAAGDLA